MGKEIIAGSHTPNHCRYNIRALWRLIGLASIIGCVWAAPAWAAGSQVFLEDATIVGAGGTLTIDQLQFTNGSSKIQCNDVTIPFSVSGGSLVIGTPQLVACPALQTNGFAAGTYAFASSPKDNTIKVDGPAAGTGGSTVWALSLVSTPDSGTWMLDSQWTAGPLSANPEAEAYLKNCGITPDPNVSYGFGKAYFSSNTLVSLVQTGGDLSVQAYSDCSVLFTVTYSRLKA